MAGFVTTIAGIVVLLALVAGSPSAVGVRARACCWSGSGSA